MIRSVLDEIKASAEATLPTKIDAIAAKYGVQLDRTFTSRTWWQSDAGVLALSFPVLGITWARPSATSVRGAHSERAARHVVTLSYGVRSLDLAYIERHITLVPEAMLLWLDEFPIASRSPAATILSVAGGKGDEIEVTHDLVAKDTAAVIWSADVTVPIYALDENLPARS